MQTLFYKIKSIKHIVHFIGIIILSIASLLISFGILNGVAQNKHEKIPSQILLVDDFEDISAWSSGLEAETIIVHSGNGAGRWDDTINRESIRRDFTTPLDASGMDFVQLWLYSGQANNALVEFIFSSENDADPAGSDYYRYQLEIDWTGWRNLRLSLSDFTISRNPIGWHQLNQVKFSAGGWGHEPITGTFLIFDDLLFGQRVITDSWRTMAYSGNDFVYTYTLVLQERTGVDRIFTPSFNLPPTYPFSIVVAEPTIALAANSIAQTEIYITVPANIINSQTWLDSYEVQFLLLENGLDVDSLPLAAAVPLPPRPSPRLLLDDADFSRIQTWVSNHTWASNQRDNIIEAADEWPTVFTQTYYLTDWALPPEGGQWGMWYICPNGVALEYQGPNQHFCPINGQTYNGWPYDQVIYSRMHDDLADFALNLGLAYQLTGQQPYAQSAAEILLAYSDVYRSYPYHDSQGGISSSGARVHAQTLDEAIWLISMAWAYDLIADSSVLTPLEQNHIEQNLLQEAVLTIRRHQQGVSNWQSWHNAGLGAVGFALEDPVVIAYALHDEEDGFYFQMENSVTADGFWYEGAWSYHFYALRAHRYLAEMAVRAGLNLYNTPQLEAMFITPLYVAMPDSTLPPFNDSRNLDLIGQDKLYEAAYNRYDNPLFTTLLGRRTRQEEALLWGMETLPTPTDLDLKTTLFPNAGYAVLRNDESQTPHYLALDYGPHGGGHGHTDKLGFIFYSHNTMLAVDPGTQSYAAPSHETWDKTTLAHNTIVIDEKAQAETTGNLHRFLALPSLSLATADAGQAYTTTQLLRTMLLASDYVLDYYLVTATDNQPHQIDWIYHNVGTLTSTLALNTYQNLPNNEGYQHLENTTAVTTATNWEATFQLTDKIPGSGYGDIWTNEPTITATFVYQQLQAFQGEGAARLGYDFSSTTGYILYQTPSPEPIDEIPSALSLAIYGDGSGHQLTLRLYDSTEERFRYTVGPIDWTGWRLITATDVISWGHYLGNDDGIFDTPVKLIAVQLDSEVGGPLSGNLYVDDITLIYEEAGVQVVENFEPDHRSLRLQMLGQVDTTIVTGEGLGPDLLDPVPFVMARRFSQNTTFATLLEPVSDSPHITDWSYLSTTLLADDQAAAFAINTITYTDHLLIVATGPAGYNRTFGQATCDGWLCLIRRDQTNQLSRLILANTTTISQDGTILLESAQALNSLQADYTLNNTRLDLHLETPLSSYFRIWGPDITEVWINGVSVAFAKVGNYVVFDVESVYLPLVLK